MMRARVAIVFLCVLNATPVHADDLYKGGNWASLAADRKASQVGDLLTIQVMANNSASNTVSQGSHKRTSIDGQATAGHNLNNGGNNFQLSGSANFGGTYEGEGTNARANRMAAQLSVTVTEVLPNGDLVISGAQALNISGERTNIKVTGRVRSEDISSDNAVLSSRLADARIEYNGKGFSSRSAKPGIVSRIFNFLGIL